MEQVEKTRGILVRYLRVDPAVSSNVACHVWWPEGICMACIPKRGLPTSFNRSFSAPLVELSVDWPPAQQWWFPSISNHLQHITASLEPFLLGTMFESEVLGLRNWWRNWSYFAICPVFSEVSIPCTWVLASNLLHALNVVAIGHTVDGRNRAPLGRWFIIPLFTEFHSH